MPETPILDILTAKFPIAGALFKIVTPAVIDAIRKQPPGKAINEVMTDVAPAIEKIADRNPEIKNDLNLEHPAQSRVVQGNVISMLTIIFAATGHLILMFHDFNITTFEFAAAGAEITAIVANAYALYGRLKSGLEPVNFLWLFGKK